MDENDPLVLAKLLRACAQGAEAKNLKHDIIFNAAADKLEAQAFALRIANDTINLYLMDTKGVRQ